MLWDLPGLIWRVNKAMLVHSHAVSNSVLSF